MNTNIRDEVMECAKELWEECPYDFCVQSEQIETIVFGSVNRVVWSVWRGFRIQEGYCTDQFIKHYYKIIPEG